MYLDAQQSRPLTQLVLKPTVFCYHRCPYCDLRQDYYKNHSEVPEEIITAGCT